jgi:hypothetical protein
MTKQEVMAALTEMVKGTELSVSATELNTIRGDGRVLNTISLSVHDDTVKHVFAYDYTGRWAAALESVKERLTVEKIAELAA